MSGVGGDGSAGQGRSVIRAPAAAMARFTVERAAGHAGVVSGVGGDGSAGQGRSVIRAPAAAMARFTVERAA
ncbi:hypothetical protein CTI14_71430, partial [Methylobacterium radiotolerans]